MTTEQRDTMNRIAAEAIRANVKEPMSDGERSRINSEREEIKEDLKAFESMFDRADSEARSAKGSINRLKIRLMELDRRLHDLQKESSDG